MNPPSMGPKIPPIGQAKFITPYVVANVLDFTLSAITVILAGMNRLKATMLSIVYKKVSSQVLAIAYSNGELDKNIILRIISFLLPYRSHRKPLGKVIAVETNPPMKSTRLT